MNKSNMPLFIQADYAGYTASFGSIQAAYFDYTRNMCIETQVKCNDKCSFFPYPASVQ